MQLSQAFLAALAAALVSASFAPEAFVNPDRGVQCPPDTHGCGTTAHHKCCHNDATWEQNRIQCTPPQYGM